MIQRRSKPSFNAVIATGLRVLFKPLALLLAGTQTSAAASHATAVPVEVALARQTLPAFLDQLRRDEALRSRFARSPREVLGEGGLDLPAFDLPDRFTDAEIDRLLQRWTASIDPTFQVWRRPSAQDVADAGPPKTHQRGGEAVAPPVVRASALPVYGPPPAPVYGPPPTPPPAPVDRQPVTPPVHEPPTAPPLPAYGPPPGPRR